MSPEELKVLLRNEPAWTIVRGRRVISTLPSSDVHLDDGSLVLGRTRFRVDWFDVSSTGEIRLTESIGNRSARISLFPGDAAPADAALRARRAAFGENVGLAIRRHFGIGRFDREVLAVDRSQSIGEAYPRFVAANRAFIAVDPAEAQPVIDALLRNAIMWGRRTRCPTWIVLPEERSTTLRLRIAALGGLSASFSCLLWDGERVRETDNFERPEGGSEVAPLDLPLPDLAEQQITEVAPPGLLAPVRDIRRRGLSIRLRGLEVGFAGPRGVTWSLPEPIRPAILQLAEWRSPGSRHPLARIQEERWLESNLMGCLNDLVPGLLQDHVYPQVPTLATGVRNIVDLLTVTREGRLVVMEIKASADPELPFQALDYWTAVEHHRRSGEFRRQGYFEGVSIADRPALLVMIAPAFSFHRTTAALLGLFPPGIPWMTIGLDGRWKQGIKVLHRRTTVS